MGRKKKNARSAAHGRKIHVNKYINQRGKTKKRAVASCQPAPNRVLLQEMPFVLKKRVYAVAAIVGALGYALLMRMGVNGVMAYALGMMATIAVRILATVFRWNLPKAI